MTRTCLIDMASTDMRKSEFLAYANYLATKTEVWLDGDRMALMAELPEGPQ